MANLKAERDLVNDSSEPMTYNVAMSTAATRGCTVTMTETTNFSYTNSITIGCEALGFGSELSTTFTVSNEIGSECSSTTEVQVSDSVTVTVEPQSRKVVKLVVTWTNLKKNSKSLLQSMDGSGQVMEKRLKGITTGSFLLHNMLVVLQPHPKCVEMWLHHTTSTVVQRWMTNTTGLQSELIIYELTI